MSSGLQLVIYLGKIPDAVKLGVGIDSDDASHDSKRVATSGTADAIQRASDLWLKLNALVFSRANARVDGAFDIDDHAKAQVILLGARVIFKSKLDSVIRQPDLAGELNSVDNDAAEAGDTACGDSSTGCAAKLWASTAVPTASSHE